MPNRYVTDYKNKRVVDSQTGEEIKFNNDDGSLTMLASFLYNSMDKMIQDNKESNEIRN